MFPLVDRDYIVETLGRLRLACDQLEHQAAELEPGRMVCLVIPPDSRHLGEGLAKAESVVTEFSEVLRGSLATAAVGT